MSEMKEQGKIYSYHNFIYPFIWEDPARKVNKKEIIESYFENNEYWENINRDNEVFSKSDWIKLYSKNEYFHAAFKEAILGYNDKYKCDKSIVAQYEFNKKYISKGAEYIITKSVSENNEFKKKEYILDVKSISIKIFNTGIAVLILECINYHESNLNDISNLYLHSLDQYLQSKHLFVCVADLNGLKHLNDTYGHSVGDNAIVTVSAELLNSAPHGSRIVRTGGDEFLLIAALDYDCNEPYEMENKFDSGLKEYNITHPNNYSIGASYGWVLLPLKENMVDIDEYISMADVKMYEMKTKRDKYRRD